MIKIKRILIALLSVMLMLAALPVSAGKQTVSTDFYEGFILKKDVHYSASLSFDSFGKPSTVYYHDLAQLSFMLVTSAFKNNTENLSGTSLNLRKFFTDNGFENISIYDYDVVPSKDTIANGIAYRRMNDSQGEFCLVAVPICGQGYGDEWVNNFIVGSTSEHSGFTDSAKKVYSRLLEYIDTNLKGERVKLWVTGYSRSAAVSNILGHLILSDNKFEQDNVFVYTFGSPNTAKKPVVYPQIFNIVDGFDPISKIPFSDWDYGRYGITMTLPTPCTNVNYTVLSVNAQKIYTDFMGNKSDKITLTERNWLITRLLLMIYRSVPESELYTEGYQEAFCKAWVEPGKIEDKLNIFIETAKKNNCNTEGIDKIYDQFCSLLEGSLDYAAGIVLNREKDNTWADVFSSGEEFAHEHFAVTYLSWLFSTDDSDKLYSGDDTYTSIAFNSGSSLHVSYLTEDNKEETIYDENEGIFNASVVDFNGVTYLDIPNGRNYQITITAEQETKLSIYYSQRDVSHVSGEMDGTDEITLLKGDYVLIDIPADPCESFPSILRNGTGTLFLHISNNTMDFPEFSETAKNDDDKKYNLNYLISEFISLVPEILGMLILLVWGIFILIRRIEDGPSHDYAECSTVLKLMFIFIAVFAAASAIHLFYGFFNTLFDSEGASSNTVFSRVSEIVNIRIIVYYIYAITVQIALLSTSLRCIGHYRSRLRLGILSVVILLLDFISLFFTLSYDLFSRFFICYQILPVTALCTVIVAAVRQKKIAKSELQQDDI